MRRITRNGKMRMIHFLWDCEKSRYVGDEDTLDKHAFAFPSKKAAMVWAKDNWGDRPIANGRCELHSAQHGGRR